MRSNIVKRKKILLRCFICIIALLLHNKFTSNPSDGWCLGEKIVINFKPNTTRVF